ncbi:unnamed protein product [Linum tenue]|uniref:Uncharacterized protein n=1 Tax=Linum tenue TaxID=586396 RepID=A0AAV0RVF3_9ROSI|nr:unnamed protein product [Linum tenue]
MFAVEYCGYDKLVQRFIIEKRSMDPDFEPETEESESGTSIVKNVVIDDEMFCHVEFVAVRGSVRPTEEGEARKWGRAFTVDDAAATRRCGEVAKTAPAVEDELSRALLGEEANCSGVMGGESATDVKEEDPVATATPPPVAETPTIPSPPTEAVAVADDFSAIVSPPHKLAVAIRSHALMTEKIVAHPQLTSTATPVVGDIAAAPNCGRYGKD